KLDGEDARVADYFDVIAGPSRGLKRIGRCSMPNEEGRFLVLFLGTGSTQVRKYDAKKASKWSILRWLKNRITNPLLDLVSRTIQDINKNYDSIIVGALHSSGNFLRIQDENLVGVTKKNLKNLVKVGEELLKKPISRFDFRTGEYGPSSDQGTNEEALIRLAAILSKEKRLRTSGFR
ncbi:hypothetical protein MIMGU_mgv1a019654mg, partial [Erythranthe guttata]